YRNPSLIGAQYPPTATIPTEARGGSPAGTPGGIVATHVVATEQPAATAEAQGGRGGDGGPVVVQGGSSSSHGELRADGAVLTRATSMASGVAIGGGAVTFSSATTEAVTTVPPAGPLTTALKVTVTGLLVGGVPAELTDRGLGISDEVPVGAAQLAAFNAAVGQLAARGITITAAPTVREIGAGEAVGVGAAGVRSGGQRRCAAVRRPDPGRGTPGRLGGGGHRARCRERRRPVQRRRGGRPRRAGVRRRA